MIIVLKQHSGQKEIDRVENLIKTKGLDTHIVKGAGQTIIGCIGDTSRIDAKLFEVNPYVDKVIHVQEPYKLANRAFHPEDTVVDVSGVKVGSGNMAYIAGPCSVETYEQVLSIAKDIKAAGANMLRGGAFKPRTSPYSFQGLGEDGLKLMKMASEETGLDTICEVTSCKALEIAVNYVDMIQVGARNMQNFELLKEIGHAGLPVMLKRGLSATIDEWLNAAEYIMSYGNEQVTLCERGIRTFETATRNTLDLSAVCVLKERTHLPVIVDPSHATGVRSYIPPLSKAAVACGADGLIIEVHPDPSCALSDGPQSLNIPEFEQFMKELRTFTILAGRVF